jgi:hypothetical protein
MTTPEEPKVSDYIGSRLEKLDAENSVRWADKHKRWELDNALAFVRWLQPLAMQFGFWLALAGGVLNNGYSDNDLDLAAVPRGDAAQDTEGFLAYMASTGWTRLKRNPVPCAIRHKFQRDGFFLDLIIMKEVTRYGTRC